MTVTIEQVEKEIETVTALVTPLLEKRTRLSAQLRVLKSKAWLKANNVRRDDVELSDGADKPWHWTIYRFGEWLKANSKKRFCEWNGAVYFVSEIVAGRMDHNAPGRIEHVED